MRINGSLLSTIFAVILFTVLIWITDFQPLSSYLKNHQGSVGLLFIIYLLMHLFRIGRNYVLLRINDFTQISFVEFLPSGLVAGTISVYGPLKSGELVSIEIYKQHLNIRRGASLGVVILGRAIDILFVVIFATSAIFIVPEDNLTEFYTLLGSISIVVLFIFLILLYPKFGLTILSFLEQTVPEKLKFIITNATNIAREYYDSMKLIIEDYYSKIILTTFTGGRWIFEIIFAYILYNSFSFELSIFQIMPVIGFSYAIGVASGTPGALGTSQFTSLSILIFYGIESQIAALSIVVGTIIGTIVNLSSGFLGLLLNYFKVTQISYEN